MNRAKDNVARDLDATEALNLARLDAYWRACNYLAAGMIYLLDNPLLREPLAPEHIKTRLLGHWGSSPGLSFIYVHLNRAILKHDLNAIFITGPGHGAPGVLAPTYLEGTYSEIYPDKSADAEGLKRFLREFSFPGGIGSHCTPEMPGSLHEGGELGYSLAHAFGAAFDNPDLLVACVVGDGEAETGALATSWHSNKFLNPIRDGAVLPILHLNGYKIDNPTLLARIPGEELAELMRGYGWAPYFVEGGDPQAMHRDMASAVDACVEAIREIQRAARTSGKARRAHWPMLVLRSPKGWTGPDAVDGHRVEGYWRSHQVPVTGVRDDPEHLALLEKWLRGYRPEELFDSRGGLKDDLRALAPQGRARMSANPHTNGGVLRKPLRLPEFRAYAVEVDAPGAEVNGNTMPLGEFLRDVLHANPDNFRIFGPDETSSNKLSAVYAETRKTWLAEYLPEDSDGGNLAPDGRVMEMLSETTLEGWLEGYLLTGRHGLLSSYEAFIHIIDSMFNQHAKWLDIAEDIPWRAPIASLNLLITSTVWRQDHNGFSHQDPGFLDVVVNKSPTVTRVYLPPDANCLLYVADHCLRDTNHINVIVSDKQKHPQYLDMETAVRHCRRGLGIWEWASNDRGGQPDLVLASCGDIATQEALAAVMLLREQLPELKIRFINIVDLFSVASPDFHPHGLTDTEFDSLFTSDRPILLNFHGYPWLIHRLTYRRNGHRNLHVRGYLERGSINTPLELAIQNHIDRFSLAIDAIRYLPGLNTQAAYVAQDMRDRRNGCLEYAHRVGIDREDIRHWRWQTPA